MTFVIIVVIIIIAILFNLKNTDSDFDSKPQHLESRTRPVFTEEDVNKYTAPLVLDSPEALFKLRQIYHCFLSVYERFDEPYIYWLSDRAVISICLEDMLSVKLWRNQKDPLDREIYCEQLFDKIFPNESLCNGVFSRSHPEELAYRLFPNDYDGWLKGEPYKYSPDDNFDLCYLLYVVPLIYPDNEDEKEQLKRKYE